MVVLQGEIDTAMLINSIWLKCCPGYDSTSTFQDLKIYVGLSDLDQLTTNFLGNYIPGTRTLVAEGSPYPISASQDEWFEIPFSQAYSYNGVDNLLLEFEWSTGTRSIYDWQWNAGPQRALFSGNYASFPEGDYFETLIPNLLLDGSVGLDEATLGAIKSGTSEE